MLCTQRDSRLQWTTLTMVTLSFKGLTLEAHHYSAGTGEQYKPFRHCFQLPGTWMKTYVWCHNVTVRQIFRLFYRQNSSYGVSVTSLNQAVFQMISIKTHLSLRLIRQLMNLQSYTWGDCKMNYRARSNLLSYILKVWGWTPPSGLSQEYKPILYHSNYTVYS